MPATVNEIADAVAMDQIVTRSILAVLLRREISRGADAKKLNLEIHGTIDGYKAQGKTSQSSLEIDRQRARDAFDALYIAVFPPQYR